MRLLRHLTALVIMAHGIVYLNAARGILPMFEGWRGSSLVMGTLISGSTLMSGTSGLWLLAGLAAMLAGVTISFTPNRRPLTRYLSLFSGLLGLLSFAVFWDGQGDLVLNQGVIGAGLSLAILSVAAVSPWIPAGVLDREIRSPSARMMMTIVGLIMGVGGASHGPGEMLQSDVVPPGLLIRAWPSLTALDGEPAMTVLPSLLLTGILAIVFGLAVAWWSLRRVHEKHGGLIMMLLSLMMLLFGAGLVPPLILAISTLLYLYRVHGRTFMVPEVLRP